MQLTWRRRHRRTRRLPRDPRLPRPARWPRRTPGARRRWRPKTAPGPWPPAQKPGDVEGARVTERRGGGVKTHLELSLEHRQHAFQARRRQHPRLVRARLPPAGAVRRPRAAAATAAATATATAGARADETNQPTTAHTHIKEGAIQGEVRVRERIMESALTARARTRPGSCSVSSWRPRAPGC